MLTYNEIKTKSKGKGIRLQDLAVMVGYSYAGFIKAVKENSLNHEARMKLNEILDIPLNNPTDCHPNNLSLSEEKTDYKKITLVDELKHINSMLMEQLKVKDMQIERLTELLKNEKKMI